MLKCANHNTLMHVKYINNIYGVTKFFILQLDRLSQCPSTVMDIN